MENYLLVWDRFGDYHFARLNELQKTLEKKSARVYGISLSNTDALYQWKVDESKLNHVYLGQSEINFLNLRQLYALICFIRKENINVVCLPALSRPIYMLTTFICFMMKVKTIVFYESWYESTSLKTSLKKIVLKIPNKIFVSGINTTEYLVSIGVNRSKIFQGYSVVDDNFYSKVKSIKKEKLILCVARRSSEKNLQFLVDSFLSHELCQKYKLLLVGEGPQVLDIPVNTSSIEIMVWQSKEVLKTLYNCATCSILPSEFEPWGLVVNESLHCGTPVVLSDKVGCVPEFGYKDLLFRHDSVEDLHKCFSFILNSNQRDLDEITQMQSKSLERYTLKVWSESIIENS